MINRADKQLATRVQLKIDASSADASKLCVAVRLKTILLCCVYDVMTARLMYDELGNVGYAKGIIQFLNPLQGWLCHIK